VEGHEGIRQRTLILIAGTTVGLLGILYTIAALLFLSSFPVGRREALRGLEQAKNALASEAGRAGGLQSRLASWTTLRFHSGTGTRPTCTPTVGRNFHRS